MKTNKKFWRTLLCVFVFALLIGGDWFLTGETSSFLISLGICSFLIFLVLALHRGFLLWKARKQGVVGSRLHVHLVILFSIMSLVPAGLVMIFSAVFFNVGVESWLGKPVQKTLKRSYQLSLDYLKQHQNVIKFDINAISPDLSSIVSRYPQEQWGDFLSYIAEQKGFSDILIFNSKGEILAKSTLTFAFVLDPDLTKVLDENLEELQYGTTHIIRSNDRVKAISRIDEDHYLFVGRPIDDDVQNYIKKTHKAIDTFEALSKERHIFFKSFVIIFGLFSFVLLASSVWIGLALSNALLHPIRSLIRAAKKVSEGDLNTRVKSPKLNNEIDILADAFNQMVMRVQEQKNALAVSERKAAWSDVARKIAHEIKNPLTPIQLGAERLKRRYLQEIKSTPEDFSRYVDTIIRHVGYIQNLVQEFSSFARMPEPCPMKIDIVILCQDHVNLLRQAYPAFSFEFSVSHPQIYWYFDAQQILQAITNLLQNAILILNEKKIENPLIHLSLTLDQDLTLIVEDNGPGFPLENRQAFLEPYYTTRREGTGLGLAIVNRIVMDHKGTISLTDRPGGGARIVLIFKECLFNN